MGTTNAIQTRSTWSRSGSTQYTVMFVKNFEARIKRKGILTKTLLENGAEAPKGGPPPPFVERSMQRDLEGRSRGRKSADPLGS